MPRRGPRARLHAPSPIVCAESDRTRRLGTGSTRVAWGEWMKISLGRQEPENTPADALVVPLALDSRLPRQLAALDRALGGQIKQYLGTEFEGKAGQFCLFMAKGVRAATICLIGLGEADRIRAETVRSTAGRAIRELMQRQKASSAVCLPSVRGLSNEAVAQAWTEGSLLGAYQFGQYMTLQPMPPAPKRMTLLAADDAHAAEVRKGIQTGSHIADSVAFARDLSNEPGSVNTPARMADRARKLAREVGLRARIFTPPQLEKAGMGGILAVGRGSVNPPRLIVLEYGSPEGRKNAKRPTIALVGKGITFDTGGISIKPAQNMHEMKGDMSGGAAVLGAMRAIAKLKLPLNVVGVVAAAENKPDGDAYLPGDIVHTAKGITLEILNTDAEGRVVLSDALHHATSYKPNAIIDLATLTGAKIVALGNHCCAVMGNDEGLIERVRAAGDRAHERAWPLPLWDEYKEQIRGEVGDLKNTGGRDGGSITAGALLSYFVGEIPWAHLDIAGNESTPRDLPYCPRGATGFGVRLLVELLREWK